MLFWLVYHRSRTTLLPRYRGHSVRHGTGHLQVKLGSMTKYQKQRIKPFQVSRRIIRLIRRKLQSPFNAHVFLALAAVSNGCTRIHGCAKVSGCSRNHHTPSPTTVMLTFQISVYTDLGSKDKVPPSRKITWDFVPVHAKQ